MLKIWIYKTIFIFVYVQFKTNNIMSKGSRNNPGHATSRNVNAKGHGRPAPMTTKAGYNGSSRRRYDNGGKTSK